MLPSRREDVFQFVREVSASYDKAIVGLPIFNGLPYLYLRRDVFAMQNLTAPHTWSDLLDLARALNGTDFNGDGQPDYAMCFDPVGYQVG